MLADIDLVDDTSSLYTVRCACLAKNATSQLYRPLPVKLVNFHQQKIFEQIVIKSVSSFAIKATLNSRSTGALEGRIVLYVIIHV